MGVSDAYGSYGSYGSTLRILKFFADGLREDQDIVQIRHTEDIQIFAQDLVHPSLERGRGICESEQHDAVLVQPTVPSSERCLAFVSGLDPEVVVDISDIEFGVDGGT